MAMRRMVCLLAGGLLALVSPVTQAADPATACRVRDVTRDTYGHSLIRMVEKARDGDRLTVRGTCSGYVVIDVDIIIVGIGKEATLAADGTSRVIRVPSRTAVVLRDLIVEGGEDTHGGGIMNSGRLRLVRVTVQGNHVSQSRGGVGIYSKGMLTMVDSVVRRNHAWYSGGLSLGGTTTLRRTRVVANSASDQGSGGGISNGGTLTIIESTIARNKVDFGSGGGIRNGGTLTLIDSVVRSNVVRLGSGEDGWGSGGGIYNWAGYGTVALDVASSVTNNVPDDCVGTPAC